jgi:predicted amidohydrolase
MRVAMLQLDIDLDQPLPARVDRAAALVRDQLGVELVVLPELWPQGGFAYDRWAEEADSIDGAITGALRAAAADVGAMVHMGSFVERAHDGRLYNTAVLIGADGEVVAIYRKIHLFGFGSGEPAIMTAGEQVVTHDRYGLATCYDLRFPELFRRFLDAGVEVVLLVSAWPAQRAEHWRVLTRARAIENQCVVVACNAAGEHDGVRLAGASALVGPRGEVLAEAGVSEEVLIADVDLAEVKTWRDRFPALRDRRL